MKYRFKTACLASAILFGSISANATVSEFSNYYVPYKPIQSDKICLSKQIMAADFGIPLVSLLQGTFSETRTLHQRLTPPHTYRNINLLAAPGGLIIPKYNFDRAASNGVTDYSFTFDMAALSALNGSSTQGRQKTVDIAKLAVIATVKTAELAHGKYRFRVWMKFENLPSLAGLTGHTINIGGIDQPAYPYVSNSPLYKRYLVEMIGANCRV